jgi:hypothetical protein
MHDYRNAPQPNIFVDVPNARHKQKLQAELHTQGYKRICNWMSTHTNDKHRRRTPVPHRRWIQQLQTTLQAQVTNICTNKLREHSCQQIVTNKVYTQMCTQQFAHNCKHKCKRTPRSKISRTLFQTHSQTQMQREFLAQHICFAQAKQMVWAKTLVSLKRHMCFSSKHLFRLSETGVDCGIGPGMDGCLSPRVDCGIGPRADGCLSPGVDCGTGPRMDGCLSPRVDCGIGPGADWSKTKCLNRCFR